jgi:hypothetical protein
MTRAIASAPPGGPGLSETLAYAKHPRSCQACGIMTLDLAELTRWRECDARDRPTAIIIVLCRACSDRLIRPHPRLYHAIDPLAPTPGIMALCVDCAHRRGTGCTSPELKANGGAGLEIRFPRPDSVHLCYGGGRGEFKQLYHGAPTHCAGREVLA